MLVVLHCVGALAFQCTILPSKVMYHARYQHKPTLTWAAETTRGAVQQRGRQGGKGSKRPEQPRTSQQQWQQQEQQQQWQQQQWQQQQQQQQQQRQHPPAAVAATPATAECQPLWPPHRPIRGISSVHDYERDASELNLPGVHNGADRCDGPPRAAEILQSGSYSSKPDSSCSSSRSNSRCISRQDIIAEYKRGEGGLKAQDGGREEAGVPGISSDRLRRPTRWTADARKQRAARGADLHGGGDPYPCATRTPRRGNLHTLACDHQETRIIERWAR